MSVDFHIEFEGLDELRRDLERAGGNLDDVLRQAMLESLQIVGSQAKLNAPVDTGRLRASIGAKTMEGVHEVRGIGADVVGRIGTRVKYAPYQEIGRTTKAGRWIEGRHYLERAAKSQAGEVVRIFRRAIDRLLGGFRL